MWSIYALDIAITVCIFLLPTAIQHRSPFTFTFSPQKRTKRHQQFQFLSYKQYRRLNRGQLLHMSTLSQMNAPLLLNASFSSSLTGYQIICWQNDLAVPPNLQQSFFAVDSSLLYLHWYSTGCEHRSNCQQVVSLYCQAKKCGGLILPSFRKERNRQRN